MYSHIYATAFIYNITYITYDVILQSKTSKIYKCENGLKFWNRKRLYISGCYIYAEQ